MSFYTEFDHPIISKPRNLSRKWKRGKKPGLVRQGWRHWSPGADGHKVQVCVEFASLAATLPGDTTMATLEQVRISAKGGSARIQR